MEIRTCRELTNSRCSPYQYLWDAVTVMLQGNVYIWYERGKAPHWWIKIRKLKGRKGKSTEDNKLWNKYIIIRTILAKIYS